MYTSCIYMISGYTRPDSQKSCFRKTLFFANCCKIIKINHHSSR